MLLFRTNGHYSSSGRLKEFFVQDKTTSFERLPCTLSNVSVIVSVHRLLLAVLVCSVSVSLLGGKSVAVQYRLFRLCTQKLLLRLSTGVHSLYISNKIPFLYHIHDNSYDFDLFRYMYTYMHCIDSTHLFRDDVKSLWSFGPR